MIELQYFERSDFKQLIEWIDSPQFLLQWSGPAFQYPLSENQLEKYMEHSNEDDADTLIYKVLDRETRCVIGHISLGEIDRQNRSARIGKVLVGDESVRGKGIGGHMMQAILRVAFEELNLHKVSLGVFDFNYSAIACYEKVGFKKVRLLKEERKYGNEYWSLWEMNILENEFVG